MNNAIVALMGLVGRGRRMVRHGWLLGGSMIFGLAINPDSRESFFLERSKMKDAK